MPKRRCRVVLECEVEIRDLTRERIEADYWTLIRALRGREEAPTDFTSWEPPSAEEIQDLRVLQEALVRSPERLNAWVKDQVTQHLDYHGVQGARPEMPVSEEEILRPIIESLPPRQRHRFREAVASGDFPIMADPFYDSIDFDLRLIEFTDLGEELPESR